MSADRLTELLDADDRDHRAGHAAIAAACAADPAVLAALRDRLQADSPFDRIRAATVLVRMGDRDAALALAVLVKFTGDGQGISLQAWAFTALGECAPTVPAARIALLRALAHHSEEFQEQAARDFAACAEADVVPLLASILATCPPEYYRGIGVTLQALGEKPRKLVDQ